MNVGVHPCGMPSSWFERVVHHTLTRTVGWTDFRESVPFMCRFRLLFIASCCYHSIVPFLRVLARHTEEQESIYDKISFEFEFWISCCLHVVANGCAWLELYSENLIFRLSTCFLGLHCICAAFKVPGSSGFIGFGIHRQWVVQERNQNRAAEQSHWPYECWSPNSTDSFPEFSSAKKVLLA